LVGESKERVPAADELWKLAFKRLVPWTMKTHRVDKADAEETVQEGIRQFLAAGGDADPAEPKALLQALGSRINGVMVDRRRKKAARAVALTADGSPAEAVDPGNFERELLDDDLVRKAVSALLERLEGDELATAVLMQMSEGVDDADTQAKALGRDVRDVYKARRRLKTHAEAVEKLMGGS
jgi:hypothetical protein